MVSELEENAVQPFAHKDAENERDLCDSHDVNNNPAVPDQHIHLYPVVTVQNSGPADLISTSHLALSVDDTSPCASPVYHVNASCFMDRILSRITSICRQKKKKQTVTVHKLKGDETTDYPGTPTALQRLRHRHCVGTKKRRSKKSAIVV